MEKLIDVLIGADWSVLRFALLAFLVANLMVMRALYRQFLRLNANLEKLTIEFLKKDAENETWRDAHDKQDDERHDQVTEAIRELRRYHTGRRE